jgi:tetratricopeptide (TPR) repeat protein
MRSLRDVAPSVPESVEQTVLGCLDPDPARRPDAATLAAALRAELPPNPRTEPNFPSVRHRPGWRPFLSALMFLVLGAAITWGLYHWFVPRPPPPAPPSEPVSVLVADFDNQTGDPVFHGTLEQAVTIALEGASFITTYPRTNAQTLAAQIRPGSSLDESGARLVAAREGIKIVLTGSIAARGTGYTLAVKAVDPSNGQPLATADTSVASKAQVLKGIEAVTSKLRDALGDTTPESARRAEGETVTAASLEALHSYSMAQDLASTGRQEESIPYYRKAIELDANFGRAYSGWATALFNLGRRDEAAEVWKKTLPLLERMTEREKHRTLGAYYLGPGASYEQAIENYRLLVEQYPADRAGQTNLALAYFQVLDLHRAMDHGRKAVEIYPQHARARSNYALYAMYAGDFKTAAHEARKVIEQSPATYKAYLPLAAAAYAASNPEGMRDAYAQMAKTGTPGASLARLGLGDLALYQGRSASAMEILRTGIAADDEAGYRVAKAAKLVALAEAQVADGRTAPATVSAREAIELIREDATLVPAALVMIRSGRTAEARAIADSLSQQFQPRSRAYGAMIDAEIARAARQYVDSADALGRAQKLADLWLGRFLLGVTNVEAGRYASALPDLELCVKRQGEAFAIFLDDVPSFRYLAPLRYWLGRAHEGLNHSTAADHYRAFLVLRPYSSRDPLAADARRRLRALAAAPVH